MSALQETERLAKLNGFMDTFGPSDSQGASVTDAAAVGERCALPYIFLRTHPKTSSQLLPLSPHGVPCQAVPCPALPCHTASCRAVPHRELPCRAMPCRAVLYCAVS